MLSLRFSSGRKAKKVGGSRSASSPFAVASRRPVAGTSRSSCASSSFSSDAQDAQLSPAKKRNREETELREAPKKQKKGCGGQAEEALHMRKETQLGKLGSRLSSAATAVSVPAVPSPRAGEQLLKQPVHARAGAQKREKKRRKKVSDVAGNHADRASESRSSSSVSTAPLAQRGGNSCLKDASIVEDARGLEADASRKKNRKRHRRRLAQSGEQGPQDGEPQPVDEREVQREEREEEKKKKDLRPQSPHEDRREGRDRSRHSLDAQKTALLQKLQGSRFRSLNQCLYTSTGDQALAAFTKDPSLFHAYHEGYRLQVAQWPSNPLTHIKAWVRTLPASWIIADLGCGDADLAKSFPERKILSFDLVAACPEVTACNVAHLPLENETVHAAVFCLSLMGRDWPSFLQEAHRILKPGGLLKIAEVISRLQDESAFIRGVEGIGFSLACAPENVKSFFFLLEFRRGAAGHEQKKLQTKRSADAGKDARPREKKGHNAVEKRDGREETLPTFAANNKEKGKSRLEASLLRPCIYKRR
ncbi:methyltransferase domain-containing protein [Toxoplasma gondii GAB2-2007-GAL-DOM2]|uniref:Ribosomal RNA-processing protein 8 n=3 Tax=Toxoplasma gondii TaxID=5811 RepID=A0A2T6IG72_TOXGO|nr:methyltransferase domain-containing protein [Toxoplasma gondii GAB2-2007-GAL-DOM2]PUA84338.1 methyltransferase domain-containing protein [Toxoplasma gondii TgCATBr9]